MTSYDDAEGYPSLPILAERQRGLARTVGDLLKWRNGRQGMDSWRAVTDDRMKGLEEKIDHLSHAVDGLRKVILGFALSIAGSAVVFALSVLVATGKIGGGR